MAISTRDELVDVVQDYLVGHTLSDAVVQTQIALAEADINRNLRHRRMMTSATADLGDDISVTVPSDWLEAIRVTLDDDILHPITLDQAEFQQNIRDGATPRFYTISGDQIMIIPEPTAGGAVQMHYFAAVPALADDNPDNWLLLNHPDLYLYATLSMAATYIADPQRGAMWRAEALRIMDELRSETMASRYSGSPLIARSRSL
jgi:hypothetical protein